MSPHLYLPAERSPKPVSALRHVAAAALLGASVGLERVARRLAVSPVPAPQPEALSPRMEFHAEAGALEGALYVDGQLVALLPGVSRL